MGLGHTCYIKQPKNTIGNIGLCILTDRGLYSGSRRCGFGCGFSQVQEGIVVLCSTWVLAVISVLLHSVTRVLYQSLFYLPFVLDLLITYDIFGNK